YRYFPEPDLVDLDPSQEWIERVRAALPPLPAKRRQVLIEASGATPAQAALVVERGLDDLCMAAIGLGAEGARAITHAEHNLSDPRATEITAQNFAKLIDMETGGQLTATQAKQVLAEMVDTGSAPDAIAAAHGFEAMDTDELSDTVDAVIAANPDEWTRFCEGDAKLTGFFVGQVMKATKGQADGKAVGALLNSKKG
ncbi:MAG: Asp-tRNA(Asn)/Glu-tRNA(Gln) amidotransferase subunit GatB, partial [Microthrixaceae bacterium]|nr:Asp-tRNA(Asn)/Glu-tRNA(Gln) amidotransferase subunit GatB [Microthrixaceae bacterium]